LYYSEIKPYFQQGMIIMTKFSISYISYSEPTLLAVAKLLSEKELTRTLVLLPSVRACTSLRQELLKNSKEQAILLPEITTPTLLTKTLAERLFYNPITVFPEHLRELVLARELLACDWAMESKSSIPGLASELISLFDEVRSAGKNIEDIDGDGELFGKDLLRVKDAWKLYRQKIKCDSVDLELNVINQICKSDSLLQINRIVLAGMNDIKPVYLKMLTHLASQVDDALIIAEELRSDDAIGQLLASGYSKPSRFHPQTPVINFVSQLTGNNPVEIIPVEHKNDKLLENLLYKCGDSESESRFVAEQVIEALKQNGSDQSIVVATADSSLAKRIIHQLEASGITVDDTGGTPLPSTKEGLLVWALLRMAVTNMQSGELLELLTHPDVKFDSASVLEFEKKLMRGHLEANGPDGFKTRIKAGSELTELLAEIIEIFECFSSNKSSWASHVANLRKAWNLATDTLLENDSKISAMIIIIGLLDSLVEQSSILPEVSLAEFTAELGRLMGDFDARPHRAENLPVQVTGLVEARLEYADLLIIAGMDADTFPGRQNRPILLGNSWRISSGLQTFENRLGLEADLFMRIIHGGKKVIITWPSEKSGRPTLPSPFISRLTTNLEEELGLTGTSPIYREVPSDIGAIKSDQQNFIDDGIEIEVTGSPLQMNYLSNSSLSKYMKCPFRFLIEKGYSIKQGEDMDATIGGKEYGSLTHAVMKTAFTETDLPRLLENKNSDGAEAVLKEVASSEFSQKGDLSQSGMWEASFSACIPEIIELELENWHEHKPCRHEVDFEFKLGDLTELDIDVPSIVEDIIISGRIDRIDISLENDNTYFVYDYKSGKPPSKKDVETNKDLQVQIYAIAVMLGKVPGLEKGNVKMGGYYRLEKNEVKIFPAVPLDKNILVNAGLVIIESAINARNYSENFRLLNSEDWDKRDPGPCKYCHLKTTCRIEEVR
jgi:hypothetical protein